MLTNTNFVNMPKGLGPEFYEYATCFEHVTDPIKGFVHKPKLKSNVKPVQQKLRRFTFCHTRRRFK